MNNVELLTPESELLIGDTDNKIDLDDIYHRIGGYGTFQKRAFAIYLLGSAYYATQIVINIFAGALPSSQSCLEPPGLDACDANCSAIHYNDSFNSFATAVSKCK